MIQQVCRSSVSAPTAVSVSWLVTDTEWLYLNAQEWGGGWPCMTMVYGNGNIMARRADQHENGIAFRNPPKGSLSLSFARFVCELTSRMWWMPCMIAEQLNTTPALTCDHPFIIWMESYRGMSIEKERNIILNNLKESTYVIEKLVLNIL